VFQVQVALQRHESDFFQTRLEALMQRSQIIGLWQLDRRSDETTLWERVFQNEIDAELRQHDDAN
jgi:hypothetical protein